MSETEIESPPGKGRRSSRRLFWWMPVVFISAVLSILAYAIGTQDGLRRMTGFAGSYLSDAHDVSLHVSGLSGTFWSGPEASEISVTLADGLKLSVSEFGLSWQLLDMFSNKRLHVTDLSASKLEVDFRGQQSVPDQDTSAITPGPLIPDLPVQIRLDAILIDQLVLMLANDAPVYAFRVEGVAGARESGAIEAELDVRRIANAEAQDLASTEVEHVTISADLGPGDDPALSLALEADVPASGLLWELLDVDPSEATDLRFTLSGNGFARDWQGDLTLDAEDQLEVEGKIGLQLSKDTVAKLDAEIELLDLSSFGVPAALNRKFSFAGGIAIDEQATTLTLNSATLQAPAVGSVTASGRLGLIDQSVLLDADVSLDSQLADLFSEDLSWASLQAKTGVTGSLGSAKFSADVDLAGVGFAEEAIEQLSVGLKGGLSTADVVAELHIDANGLEWSDPVISELIGGWAEIKSDLRFDMAQQLLTVDGSKLLPLGLSVSGLMDLHDTGAVRGSADLELDDIGVLNSVLGMDVEGRAAAVLSRYEIQADGLVDAAFDLSFEGLGFSDAALTDAIGTSARTQGSVIVAPDSTVTLQLEELRGAFGGVEGLVLVTGEFSSLDTNVNGSLDPAFLNTLLPYEVSGNALSVSLNLTGPIDQPAGRISAGKIAATVEGVDVVLSETQVDLDWSGEGAVLDSSAKGQIAGAPLSVDALIAAKPESLKISALDIRGVGTRITGELEMPANRFPAVGKINVASSVSEIPEALTGLKFEQGRAALEVGLEVVEGQGTETQLIDIVGGGTGILARMSDGGAEIDLGSLQVKGRVERAISDPAFDLALDTAGLRLDTNKIDTLRLVASGTQEAIDLDAAMTVSDPATLQLRTLGRLEFGDEDMRFDLSSLAGEVEGIDFDLRDQGRLRLRDGGAVQVEGGFFVDAGQVNLDLLLDPLSSSRANIEVAGLPIEPFALLVNRAGLTGTLNGEIDLLDNGGGAQGEVALRLSNVRTAAAWDLPPLSANSRVVLDRGRLSADFELDAPGVEITEFSINLPVQMGLAPVQFDIGEDTAISGKIDLDIQLARLNPYIPLPEHRFRGLLQLESTISGLVGEPVLDGQMTLREWQYEHLEYGTRLRDGTADIRFDGASIFVDRFTASDGTDGRVSVSGNAVLRAEDFEANGKLETSAFRFLDRDEIVASAASQLDLVADKQGGSLTGEVTIIGAEIDLGAALPPSIPQLDVIEEGSEISGEVRDETPSEDQNAYPFDLDVTISIPGQVFARGRGLDSEWGGTLALTGEASSPLITGEITNRRGRLDFLGKTFVLDRSSIRFAGAAGNDPFLGVRAENTQDGFTGIVNVTGPASDPEIRLESQPALPEEEVLSRLLFGKARGSLTGLEAAQLAISANRLSGGGGGFDLLGDLRRGLGVDVLEVDTTETGSAEVRAGAYLNENVYIGGKQGAKAGSSGVEVEVEITPNFSIRSETEQSGANNLGFEFRWDY